MSFDAKAFEDLAVEACTELHEKGIPVVQAQFGRMDRDGELTCGCMLTAVAKKLNLDVQSEVDLCRVGHLNASKVLNSVAEHYGLACADVRSLAYGFDNAFGFGLLRPGSTFYDAGNNVALRLRALGVLETKETP